MRVSILAVAVLAVLVSADVDPGEIGIQFFGNEFAHSQQIPNFPTTDFTLTFRIKAGSGHILNYGKASKTGTFDAELLALKSASSLVISRGAGTAWSTGVNFADNQWHALALTWKMSSGETKLYKDSKLVATTTLSRGLPIPVGGYLVFGQQQNCAIGCFAEKTGLVGTLADMTLWRKVLTAEQIDYLSNNSPSGDETDLVSYWPLHENEGSDGTDKTGGNNIQLGGPSWSKDVGMKDAASSLSLHKAGAVIVTPASELPTGDFTIEFWIKTSIQEDSVILSYFVEGASNKYPLVIHNPGAVKITHNAEEMRTDTNLATGAWNHAAFVWKQQTGRLKLFMNGALAYPPSWLPETDYDLMPTLDLGGVLVSKPGRIVIGNRIVCSTGSCISGGAGFDGLLQELRIWNAARDLKEIAIAKDHVVGTPFPDSLSMYFKLDELENSRTTTEAAKNNQGVLTVPMWKNNLIAPPFPTLEEVNSKVNALKDEMNELMDYIKEVLEPQSPGSQIQPNNGTFTVKDESQCDRRYKYQCTFHTQKVGGQAAAPAPAATTAKAATPTGQKSAILVQRALARQASQLSEDLAPQQHHHHHHTEEHPQAGDSGVLSVESRPAHQVESMDLLQMEALPTTTTTTATTSVSASDNARRRHAWVVPQPVPAVQEQEEVVRTVSSANSKPRHRWSAGAEQVASEWQN